MLVLVFYAPLAFTDRILGRGDTFAYFYPYWHARDAALTAGHLPLWTPLLFTGVPLLANSQLGTFYPPNWLTIGLPPPDAIRIAVLLHVLLAAVGAGWLAQIGLRLSRPACLLAAIAFAFGGYMGARAEQINQLQGLAWMPFALALTILLVRSSRPALIAVLLACVVALQLLTGHTQTTFITGVGMIIAGCGAVLARPPGHRRPILRLIGGLAIAGLLAGVLALPQLLPTASLNAISNRAGGLTPNQATAFSFSPFAVGRGLLPGYDGLLGAISNEYIAYPGVIALGLAVIGAVSLLAHGRERRRDGQPSAAASSAMPSADDARSVHPFTFSVLGGIGLFFAFGLYNPVYWALAGLPGFNLFRVPARWLALFALAAALLAGQGMDALRAARPGRWPVMLIIGVIGGLAALSPLIARLPDGTPPTPPGMPSFIGWGIAGIALLCVIIWRWRNGRGLIVIVTGLVIVELFAASRSLPYTDLVPRDVYDSRFTAHQLTAYQSAADETPPPRFLSISDLRFDPGDRAALEARFAALGLSTTATATAFTDIKLHEVIGANLPLIAGLPTADGFDGGILPTRHYTAFSALLLPPGTLRTLDGRLREALAAPPACRGACIPEARWLDLLGVRYLITDKVFDLWHADIAYDTTHRFEAGTHPVTAAFMTTAVDVLFVCEATDVTTCTVPGLAIADANGALASLPPVTATVRVGDFVLARLLLPAPFVPGAVMLPAGSPLVQAITLVDTRTGDFSQITPAGWVRTLSSDIEIYDRGSPVRAWVVPADGVRTFSDDDAGTEAALAWMRDPAFDPLTMAAVHDNTPGYPVRDMPTTTSQTRVSFVHYTDTHIRLALDPPLAQGGWLMLAEGYAPGWTAYLDSFPLEVVRANVMFRAVYVPAGSSWVTLTYQPGWLFLLPIGAAAWLIVGLGLVVWASIAPAHTRVKRVAQTVP